MFFKYSQMECDLKMEYQSNIISIYQLFTRLKRITEKLLLL